MQDAGSRVKELVATPITALPILVALPRAQQATAGG
jgi:hypothetical protein